MVFIALSTDRAAAAVTAGVLPLIFLHQLPGPTIIGSLLALSAFLWLSRNRYCQFLALAVISFLWGTWHGNGILMQIETLTQGDQQVVATINSSYLSWDDAQKVVISIQKINEKRVFPPIAVNVKWPARLDQYCAGQRWVFRLRMRAVHSVLNEGGFDSQRWAMANRRPLQGRIIEAELLDAECSLRQKIISSVEQQLVGYDQRRIMLALAFGERSQLNKEEWSLLRYTGTAHLMAISGLHIALAALFGGVLARLIQFLFPVSWIGPLLPLLIGWLIAMIYVWLAGANSPAIRAAIALTLWLLLRLFGVLCSSWQVWGWVLGLILVSDPLAVLSDSFWLSCLAVFSLICWFHLAPISSRFMTGWYGLVIRWFHLQFGMMLLLMPLQIGLFHGISLFSIPANLWAVPIVSLLTVPCVLLALALALLPAADIFWFLADISLTVVLFPLNQLKAGWLHTGMTSVAIAYCGWLALFIWRFQWWRSHPLGVVVLCINMVLLTQRRDEYYWRVDMLDIGHGLAVVIEREGKAIIYDTGNHWPTGNMASIFILPFLKWRGITVEQIILSHDHQDHTGGLSVLLDAFPWATVRAPFSVKNVANTLPCKQGERWRWQGLDFEVLWPKEQVFNAQNNDSCVIRINDGKHSILLTGDLESQGERQLVNDFRGKLASTVLQVPHHGSNTSSTAPFLRAVSPELGFASVARYNQWRLPAKKVINRYQKNGIIWRDTSISGQLSVYFYGDTWFVKGYREQLMPRWYHQRFGVRGHNE